MLTSGSTLPRLTPVRPHPAEHQASSAEPMDERLTAPNDSSSMPTWHDLSKEQQCVLFSAAEESMFIGVLANWEPEREWPERAGQIGRLAEAAKSLLRAGLIQVYHRHLAGGDTEFLTVTEALAAIEIQDNWWRVGSAADDTPELSDSDSFYYALIVTEAGGAVLQSRGDDDLYGFLRH
jgi:hypothetical protein